MRFSLLLLFFLVSIQTSVSAQNTEDRTPDRQGQFWVDGALGRQSGFDSGNTSRRMGYFLKDDLLVGVGLRSSIGWGGSTGVDYNLTVSPFLRKYFGQGKGWRPYGELSAGFSVGNERLSNYTDVTASVGLGLEKEIVPGVLANVIASYRRDEFTRSGYQLGVNFNTLIGGYGTKNSIGSQLKKGNWNFGGQPFNLSYGELGSTDIQAWNLNLRPEFAYFLTDKLMVDVRGELGYSRYDYSGRQDIGTTNRLEGALTAGIDVNLRRYFTTHKKLNFFAEAGVGYQHLRQMIVNNAGDESTFETSTFSVNAAVGATLFLNPNASLDFGLRAKTELVGNTTTLTPELFLGLRFWGKKKQ